MLYNCWCSANRLFLLIFQRNQNPTGSQLWLQKLFRERHFGWSTLYFLSKKEKPISVQHLHPPAPLASANTISANATRLWACKDLHWQKAFREEPRSPVTTITQHRGCSQSQGKFCFSHTPEIKTSQYRRIPSSINLISSHNRCIKNA